MIIWASQWEALRYSILFVTTIYITDDSAEARLLITEVIDPNWYDGNFLTCSLGTASAIYTIFHVEVNLTFCKPYSFWSIAFYQCLNTTTHHSTVSSMVIVHDIITDLNSAPCCGHFPSITSHRGDKLWPQYSCQVASTEPLTFPLLLLRLPNLPFKTT